jgi:Domain of unknown function (DUF4145)
MGAESLEGRVRSLERRLSALAEELRLALQYIPSDPGSSLTKSRVVLEKLLLRVYASEMAREPRKALLADMLADNQFTRRIERRVLSRMHAIRDLANLGPHGEPVQPSDARRVLDDLCEILEWYLSRYATPDAPQGGHSGDSAGPSATTAALRTRVAPRSIPVKLLVLMFTVLAVIVLGIWLGRHTGLNGHEPEIEVGPREEIPNPEAIQ